jgi:hypothetical protein
MEMFQDTLMEEMGLAITSIIINVGKVLNILFGEAKILLKIKVITLIVVFKKEEKCGALLQMQKKEEYLVKITKEMIPVIILYTMSLTLVDT